MGEKKVQIFEVGPRDGLQNETQHINTSDKIRLIDCLSQAGFNLIEASSFVSAKWVPGLADASEVMAGITRKKGIRYAALTPNMRGFNEAMKANADEVAVFGAASEGFSRHNINCTKAESLARFYPVIRAAQDAGIPVRGYISVVISCPYDGDTDPTSVLEMAETLLEMGCYEISLGDTIGQGTADSVSRLLDVVAGALPANLLAGHFHDTNQQAINNVFTALDYGLRKFDAAIGGLGGCPYAPGAKGNVATGLLHDALHKKGWQTGLDRAALTKAEALISDLGLLPRP